MSNTTTSDAIGRGRPYRLGADPLSDSVNFSVYSGRCPAARKAWYHHGHHGALCAGRLDDLPQGGSCIANAFTNSHEALQDPEIGALRRFGLHAIDMVGLVHAMIPRIQAPLLPIQTLVLGGH